jgi:hypothetical protein
MKDYIKHLYNIKDTESDFYFNFHDRIIVGNGPIEHSQGRRKVYKRKSKLLGLNISLKGRLKGARRARRLLHN